jgi:flagellar basal-body rod protein FlgG
MNAQQVHLHTIANNLANVSTTGYKKISVEFQDLVYESLKEPGSQTTELTRRPSEVQVGLGTQLVATSRIFSQGSIKQTNAPLDLTIEGEGFFQVLQTDGTIAYTRDGSFKITENGEIVTSDGFPLEPLITVPQDTMTLNIALDGTVSGTVAGITEPSEFGRIELARFVNPAGLKSIGRNLYVKSVTSGDPILDYPGELGMGNIRQGMLEQSNVDIVEEMINLVLAQRAYEINSKVIKASEDMLSVASRIST